MQPTDADEAFDDLVHRQIIQAFGRDVADSPEFSTEPGSYPAARAEFDADCVTFKSDVQKRAEEFAAEYMAHLVARGRLPEGVALRWGQADD